MSVFLCGLVRTAPQDPDGPERLDLAWAVQRAAVDRGIMVQLGPAILQHTVFSLLDLAPRQCSQNVFAFHLTGTPLSNTSEDAIWPSAPAENAEAATKTRAIALRDLLSSILLRPGVTEIVLVLTENCNRPTEECQITPSEFVESFLPRVEDPTYVLDMR